MASEPIQGMFNIEQRGTQKAARRTISETNVAAPSVAMAALTTLLSLQRAKVRRPQTAVR
jgi:hypothetical protein